MCRHFWRKNESRQTLQCRQQRSGKIPFVWDADLNTEIANAVNATDDKAQYDERLRDCLVIKVFLHIF